MSPLDDELRAALHGRAQVLAPSPDPLAGIERRARRIQRHRIGAAVAASALAVVAVAAVVPALQTTAAPRQDVPQFAGTPTPQQEEVSYALDPSNPWGYRGTALGTDFVDTLAREVATRHGRPADADRVVALFGQRYEPSQLLEAVFVSQRQDGTATWGVASESESGLEVLLEQDLTPGTTALVAALPGEAVARLLVVAAPERDLRAQYGSDAQADFYDLARLADGVWTGPREGSPDTDVVRVLTKDGTQVHSGPAPDSPSREGDAGTSRALDPERPWEVRGDPSLVDQGQLGALAEDWAQRHRKNDPDLELTPLYVAPREVDGAVEVVYLVRSGGTWSWGVSSTTAEGGWWWHADNPLTPGTTALVAGLPGEDGLERLLVVAAPSTGGAVYAADGSSYEPMLDPAPGVYWRSVLPGDPDDRLKVLDGDGDLDDPVFEGPAPDYQNAG